ncbi:hypothetical protein BBP40_009938 [Aspergillus hancockii]|nr:hypothetical protein BBP40_009938 [Aspergillus hancockii]
MPIGNAVVSPGTPENATNVAPVAYSDDGLIGNPNATSAASNPRDGLGRRGYYGFDEVCF